MRGAAILPSIKQVINVLIKEYVHIIKNPIRIKSDWAVTLFTQ